MPLRMWTYDLAREQAPTLDHLRRLCDVTLESGYNALGLYLEHRFAYPSTPWSHGTGSLTPEMVSQLQTEYRTLEIIPFINLLGHVEGFLYTEEGRKFAETKFVGMQACPSDAGFKELAAGLLSDSLEAFTSSIIHIGGDETQHLGACPICRRRVAEFESKIGTDGKARLFGEHFAPMLQQVTDAGRRPAIWGDMLAEHQQATGFIPKTTLIFDWQYFQSASRTASPFRTSGFDVVYCPTLHVYNATWLHLPQSEKNVVENAISSALDKAYGLCLTTWECDLFGSYETLLPAIKATGEIFSNAESLAREEEGAILAGRPSDLILDSDSPSESIPTGIADGILSGLMDNLASGATILIGAKHITVQYDSMTPHVDPARIPADPGAEAIQRICRLASLEDSRSTERRTGQITGEYKSVPFQIEVTSEPVATGMKLRLEMEPWLNSTAYSLERKADRFLKAYLREGENYEEWARLMGVDLLNAGGSFQFTGIRSGLKCRLLLYGNPFLAWLHHSDELCGPTGDAALSIFERGIVFAPDASSRGASDFGKAAVLFVRFAEEAHRAYAQRQPGAAATALMPCRQIFENLLKIARSNHLRIGGSLADIERCLIAREHVERVMRRIKTYGDGSLGYLPSFEMITHPNFVPHDQGAWWKINSWARD